MNQHRDRYRGWTVKGSVGLLREEMVSIKDCLVSPLPTIESKGLLRKVEIETKRLTGSSIRGVWDEGGGVEARIEEKGRPKDFCAFELETSGISFSRIAKLVERIASKALKSPKSTSSSSLSSAFFSASLDEVVAKLVDPEIRIVGIEVGSFQGWSIASLSSSSTRIASLSTTGDTTLSSS